MQSLTNALLQTQAEYSLQREILAVAFAALIAIGLGVAFIYAISKDKPNTKGLVLMIVVGIATATIRWTTLKDNAPPKEIVANVWAYTTLFTALSKAISNIFKAVFNIPEKTWQGLAIGTIKKFAKLETNDNNDQPEEETTVNGTNIPTNNTGDGSDDNPGSQPGN